MRVPVFYPFPLPPDYLLMHRFFSPVDFQPGSTLSLPDGEAWHAWKVLRLSPGEICSCLNGRGAEAELQLEEVSRQGVTARILSVVQEETPLISLRLYIAPPKGKNMDLLLKSATELGVTRFSPILCRYSVSKPETVKDAWNETLISACKQSGNRWLPQVDFPCRFSDALKEAESPSFVGAVPSREAPWRKWDSSAAKEKSLALWIGPEGGFSPEEEEELRCSGVIPLTIGPWILRVETAVPALLGAIWQLQK